MIRGGLIGIGIGCVIAFAWGIVLSTLLPVGPASALSFLSGVVLGGAGFIFGSEWGDRRWPS